MISNPVVRTVAITAALTVAVPAWAGPLDVTTRMLVEQRVAAADGTTRVTLVKPVHVVPGDHVAVVLAYRNSGNQPLADVVLANPLPSTIVYGGGRQGSPEPELSVDGRTFASLASLRVATGAAGTRAATAADVTSVRWRLNAPIAPGASGQFAFDAIVK